MSGVESSDQHYHSPLNTLICVYTHRYQNFLNITFPCASGAKSSSFRRAMLRSHGLFYTVCPSIKLKIYLLGSIFLRTELSTFDGSASRHFGHDLGRLSEPTAQENQRQNNSKHERCYSQNEQDDGRHLRFSYIKAEVLPNSSKNFVWLQVLAVVFLILFSSISSSPLADCTTVKSAN